MPHTLTCSTTTRGPLTPPTVRYSEQHTARIGQAFIGDLAGDLNGSRARRHGSVMLASVQAAEVADLCEVPRRSRA